MQDASLYVLYDITSPNAAFLTGARTRPDSNRYPMLNVPTTLSKSQCTWLPGATFFVPPATITRQAPASVIISNRQPSHEANIPTTRLDASIQPVLHISMTSVPCQRRPLHSPKLNLSLVRRVASTVAAPLHYRPRCAVTSELTISNTGGGTMAAPSRFPVYSICQRKGKHAKRRPRSTTTKGKTTMAATARTTL